MSSKDYNGRVEDVGDAQEEKYCRKPVWLDCDPGHDDALAIILAGHDPRLRLLGVSTVAGNQSVEKTTDNALRVLAAAGLNGIQVVKGQSRPLLRPALHCPQIHGDSGLDGPSGTPALPTAAHAAAVPGPAPIFMFEKIKEAFNQEEQRVALVATAALTNIALLLTLYPEVVHMVDIIIMGGCLGIGNTGPVVEFNMQCDPHSAHIVFESGARITLCPLEVTHMALTTPNVLQRIRSAASLGHSGSFLDAIEEILTYFADSYQKVFKFEYPPLHDPVAVAFVIRPEIFETEDYRVDIETSSHLSIGQTVIDVWRTSGKPPNATVCLKMNVEEFWKLMEAAILRAAAATEPNFATLL